jgi:hypothetical protein
MAKNTYLNKVKAHSKPLYYLLIVYIIASFFFIHTKYNKLMFIELVPVFAWGMFSASTAHNEQVIVYDLQLDGKQVNLPDPLDPRRGYFVYTIARWDDIVSNQMIDAEIAKYQTKLPNVSYEKLNGLFGNSNIILKEYPKWLKRYYSSALGENFEKIKVTKNWLHYSADGKQVLDSTKVLINE